MSKLKSIRSGLIGFGIVSLGQFVSLLGSNMTRFALSIWIWERTGKATDLALVAIFGIVPGIIATPFAGSIIDRINRKLAMLISDFAAALVTLILLLIHTNGQLQMWHLLGANAVSSVFNAFQFPAYSVAMTLMLPEEHYGRGHGFLELANSASGILGPIYAGIALGFLGLSGVLMFDIATFLMAFATLAIALIPSVETPGTSDEARGTLLQETAYGFRYVRRHSGLFVLLILFMLMNLNANLTSTLHAPLILSKPGNEVSHLGIVLSSGAVGGFFGGLLMGIWGGPKRRIYGVLVGMFLYSVLGLGIMGLSRGLIGWAIGNFFVFFFIPIINGSNRAIWLTEVEVGVQGRAISMQRFFSHLSIPIGLFLGASISDSLFEPLMTSDGLLSRNLGVIFGNEPGTGYSLMFGVTALVGVILVLVGLSRKELRRFGVVEAVDN